ncbi:MAG TPA: VanZ family protein [Acetobacteraceae bacterium]|nr:VanZ family protein [Acetobacteraceae bacterium]
MPNHNRNAGNAIAFVVIAAVIVYGSLYPFRYRGNGLPIGALDFLLHSWRTWDRRGDLLANVLLYVPFGFFAARALPIRLQTATRVALSLLAGATLSVGMELCQFRIAGRITSMGDVYANAIGTTSGAVTGAVLSGTWRWPLLADIAEQPAAAMLIAGWLGYRLYPYVPTIDLHKYWRAIKPVFSISVPPSFDLLRFTIVWLLMARLVESIFGRSRWLLLFPVLIGTEIVGRVLVVNSRLQLSDVTGAVLALLLSPLLRRMPFCMAVFAGLWLCLIVALRLEPFTFSVATRHFGWVPFLGLMRGSIAIAVQSFCEKFVLFGGLIWLLDHAGLGLKRATIGTATVLFATSVAQTHLPGRSAEITDPVMALLIGGLFALLAASLPRRRKALA